MGESTVHAPDGTGNVEIGLPYVEFFVPKNSAGKIVNFYREILGAKASIGKRHGKTCARLRQEHPNMFTMEKMKASQI